MTELNALSLRYQNQELEILDQQALPHQEVWVKIKHPQDMIQCIKALKVRGAPLIGVSAALALGTFAQKSSTPEIEAMAEALKASRPTAVNLMWAIDRLMKKIDTPQALLTEAIRIFNEDVSLCKHMGQYGAPLIEEGDQILTHCNTGGLATVGIGTALGVIQTAWESGKRFHVFVDETRPLLQGGRLTTWELKELGIPYTLITDNMAAMLMQQGKINKVFLGSDRIAMNGDFANKIGTYGVAVNAHYHQIPFYPVAPYSTLDLTAKTGKDIPIEIREGLEVRGLFFDQICWAPKDAPTYNPAFDVTPVDLVTGLVTDQGYFSQDELKSNILTRMFKQ